MLRPFYFFSADTWTVGLEKLEQVAYKFLMLKKQMLETTSVEQKIEKILWMQVPL